MTNRETFYETIAPVAAYSCCSVKTLLVCLAPEHVFW